MEKITKSTDTVLIDPNEPLILPDGTALVGRIEWFLYALCCLDYQNLPTPMSRIEEFANALITGEIPNIEPQSRAEQFFLAILDGNVSNLPQPQSRSEVLLDKLARGEFDLSDVEPIQSRYELLLAYLIKNGGIGNIDYVLYEFSEAMKTMYNTVEKPFKSLELSGNTLVNCVLEDTENDDYTSFDKDYSGTSFTINGTSEGAIKSAILKGQTLVNLLDRNNIGAEASEYTFNNGVYTVTTNRNWGKLKFTVNLSPNKRYILMGSTSISNASYYYRLSDGSATLLGNVTSCPIIFTTPSDKIENVTIEFPTVVTNGTVSYPMLLEYQQGMENWDIPYFEGMQSVKMPVLTTVGKNLFNTNKQITSNATYEVIGDELILSCSGAGWYNLKLEFFNLTPNKPYTLSYDYEILEGSPNNQVIVVDSSNTTISNNIAPSDGKISMKFYCGNSTRFGKIRYYNIQLEEVSAPTSYEPYKSNILTTTSKNLFDMNRPYDAITDSQATVVQDTNKITVSSAESGIYVNANFILDKDFFAGKTVTGSCLYESDEKDIGTVQIHYQDGNGEHHYQWIRTPKTFTFPNSFIGDVMLSVSANNTGTPQSNTVTVKNIQLELGSTATSYEPYSEGVTLRGIGDVKDELNLLTGEVVERIGEIVLDGSEEWKTDINGAGVRRYFLEGVGGDLSDSISNSSSLLCDKFKASSNIWTETNDGTQIVKSNGVYFIDSSVDSLDMFVNKLKTTNIKVQYSLIEKPVKTVDLNVVDQNNTKIDKMHVFNEVTHVNASSDRLTPTVNIGKSVSYPTIIKPSTKYTVDLKRNDKPLTVNLGGTEVTFTSGETRKTITTPSTLTNDKLSYYGVGAKCNEIMLIEGEAEGNVDYFTGMQSVVMQNQMPILSTVGKNLFNAYKHEFDTSSSQGLRVEILNSNSIRTYCTDTIAWRSAFVFYQLEPHTWYNIRCEASGNGVKQVDINIPEYGNSWNPNITGCTQSNNMLGKFLTDESGKVKISFQGNGSESISYDNTYTNIQIEKISDKNINATSYEPFKTSILSCNEDVTLRGIGDVKDELDLLTGELTEHIEEITFDGSESWNKFSIDSMINHSQFYFRMEGKLHNSQVLCDSFVSMSRQTSDNGGECVSGDGGNGKNIWINILNSRLTSSDVDGFKQWLSQNPITVQYQLEAPSIKTVELNVVDQDGNTIPKVKSHNGTTHLEVTVPKQSLLPNVSAEVATDNSKDMSSLTTKHQEISETQSAIQDNIQSQSDEIDTALMATTEIFESILE